MTGTPRDRSIPWRSALLVTVVTSFPLGGMLIWYSTLQGAGLVGFKFSCSMPHLTLPPIH